MPCVRRGLGQIRENILQVIYFQRRHDYDKVEADGISGPRVASGQERGGVNQAFFLVRLKSPQAFG